MMHRQPRCTRTDTHLPDATHFRSDLNAIAHTSRFLGDFVRNSQTESLKAAPEGRDAASMRQRRLHSPLEAICTGIGGAEAGRFPPLFVPRCGHGGRGWSLALSAISDEDRKSTRLNSSH